MYVEMEDVLEIVIAVCICSPRGGVNFIVKHNRQGRMKLVCSL